MLSILNFVFLIGILVGLVMVLKGRRRVPGSPGETKTVFTSKGNAGYAIMIISAIWFILRYTMHRF